MRPRCGGATQHALLTRGMLQVLSAMSTTAPDVRWVRSQPTTHSSKAPAITVRDGLAAGARREGFPYGFLLTPEPSIERYGGLRTRNGSRSHPLGGIDGQNRPRTPGVAYAVLTVALAVRVGSPTSAGSPSRRQHLVLEDLPPFAQLQD